MTRDIFKDIVLPSVGLPVKESYNLDEALKILGVSRPTLKAMRERHEIYISPTKRIYYEEFRHFFGYEIPDVPPTQDPDGF